MKLLLSFRSEIFKTKRTASFYLAFVAGALGPLLSLLDLLLDGVPAEDRGIILNKLFTARFQMTGFLLLPLFIVLICTLLPQVEYRNNAWKQVLTSPQPKGSVFAAKFLIVQLLVFVFLATNQLFMFLTAVVLHVAEPSLHVLNQPFDGHAILMTPINGYGVLLAVCTIQFWLGIRSKNFIVPIAVGISCWFIGSLLVLNFGSGISAYFPYSFHVFTSFSKYKSQLPAAQWTALGYTALFLIVGFADFKKRRLNG